MRKVIGLLLILAMPSIAMAQLSRPLRIQNNGTSLSPVRYNLNFVNSGCVDNALTLAYDCTVATSSTSVNLQSTSPGTAQTGNINISGVVLTGDGNSTTPAHSFANSTAGRRSTS